MSRRPSTSSTASGGGRRSSNVPSPPGSQASYILGIDVGTTSVKVCLLNSVTRDVCLKNIKDTMADIPSDLGARGNKQEVSKIYSTIHSCLSKIPKDQLRRVVHIAVCGQMHGVVMWQAGEGWVRNQKDQPVVGPGVSSLYTWQDGRCSTEFLSTLPPPASHLSLHTGYGCATIFWLLRNDPQLIAQYNRSGTVMDYVVAMMLELDAPVMSEQNAAAFGYFDCLAKEWNTGLLSGEGFPVSFLPKVVASTESAGTLPRDWFDIPAGTPVSAAMGDLQCSVKSTLENIDTDAVINVSTSAQIAFVKPEGFQPITCRQGEGEASSPVEFIPYINGRYLAVAASLTGGNALATFVRMVQMWCVELGCSIPQSKIWTVVLEAGTQESVPTSLAILPTIFGERHSPDQRGTVDNIHQGNIGLGSVCRSVCSGIIGNLASMMTPSMLLEAGVQRIVGSGACLLRNMVLQREIQSQYQMPVTFVEEGNACIGAAAAVADRFFPISP